MTNNSLDVNQMLQCADVTRWHIVRTARNQTVAEHQYLVWIIGNRLAVAFGLDKFEQKVAGTCCLIHDLPEVVTGDMPSTAKKLYSENSTFWSAVDAKVDANISSILEDAKKNNVRAYITYKLADTIEAIRFLSIEGIGHDAMVKLEWLAKSFHDQLISANNQTQHQQVNWGGGSQLISHVLRSHVMLASPVAWDIINRALVTIKNGNRKGELTKKCRSK